MKKPTTPTRRTFIYKLFRTLNPVATAHATMRIARKNDVDFPPSCAAWFIKSKSRAVAETLTNEFLNFFVSFRKIFEQPSIPTLSLEPPSPHCSMVRYL